MYVYHFGSLTKTRPEDNYRNEHENPNQHATILLSSNPYAI